MRNVIQQINDDQDDDEEISNIDQKHDGVERSDNCNNKEHLTHSCDQGDDDEIHHVAKTFRDMIERQSNSHIQELVETNSCISNESIIEQQEAVL